MEKDGKKSKQTIITIGTPEESIKEEVKKYVNLLVPLEEQGKQRQDLVLLRLLETEVKKKIPGIIK